MIIGITGSFGSGKTTVAKMFAGSGGLMVDADKVYHSLITPGKKCYKKIVRHFGKGILDKDGRIDRKKLGGEVFRKKSRLRLLDNLVHPEIIKEIKAAIRSAGKKDVIVDAALLLETAFYKDMDIIVVVANKKKEQVRRIKKAGTGLSKSAIESRIRTQMPFRKKLAFADFIIDNSGSKIQTLRRVRDIRKKLRGGKWK
ncbi:MAG: dephospho-CoA kinase [Candidatus Omnitrophota bacterium]|jgi:dephospho-CoA kinase